MTIPSIIALVETRDATGHHYHAFRREADAVRFGADWLESHQPKRAGNVSNELMRRLTDRNPERHYSIRFYFIELQ